MWRTLNSDIATENSKTVFNPDGSITEISKSKTKNTVFNSDGSITDTVETTIDGVKTKTIQTTTFNANGFDITISNGGGSNEWYRWN